MQMDTCFDRVTGLWELNEQVTGDHNSQFVSFLMLNVRLKLGPSHPFKLREAVSLPLSGVPLILRVCDNYL